MARLLCLLACALAAPADTLDPRPSPRDYAVSAVHEKATLAAEFHGRGATAGQRHWVTGEYFAVEVDVFPAAPHSITVSHGDFKMRINNGKIPRLPVSAHQVAAQIRNPGLSRQRGVQIDAGPVVIGRPRNPGNFPGDPRAGRPVPQPAPTSLPPKDETETPGYQHAIDTALPTGEARTPVAGFLYFHFEGSLKKAKSIVLEWTVGERTVALKLR